MWKWMVAAHRHPDKVVGKQDLQALIDVLRVGVQKALVELRWLGRILQQRATDVLAFFDWLGTSNGPAEASDGRLEPLRGSASGSGT